jgi:periplasmic protein CpxP/Spy
MGGTIAIFILPIFQIANMSKLGLLTVVAVSLLLLNAGTLSYLLLTQKKDNRPSLPDRGMAASDFIIKELKLDNEQQLQFIALRDRHHATVIGAQREDRRLHDIYFGLLKTDNPDKGKADSVSALIASQRSLIEAATFEHFQDLRKLCRDDQKKRFDELIDEIARRVGGPKGPPPGR